MKKTSESTLNFNKSNDFMEDRANRSALIEREVDEEIRKIKQETNSNNKSEIKSKKPPKSKSLYEKEENKDSSSNFVTKKPDSDYNDQIYTVNRETHKRGSKIKKVKDLNKE